MSESKNHHVVPHPEGWAVRGENTERAAAVASTQREAISVGREITRRQGTELLIHGENGQIREQARGWLRAAGLEELRSSAFESHQILSARKP